MVCVLVTTTQFNGSYDQNGMTIYHFSNEEEITIFMTSDVPS
jgi:hypothetical protein